MKKLKFYHFLPAIIYFSFTFYLFTLPGKDIPQYNWMEGLPIDKLVHAGLFFVLLYLFCIPFKNSEVENEKRKKWFTIVAISAIFYGIAIEFIQKYFIPNRSFDVYDILADSIGTLISFVYLRKYFLVKVF